MTVLPFWLQNLGPDLIACAVSALLVVAYYIFLHSKVKHDPTYTIHSVNQIARNQWVAGVIANPDKDIMAVQTLRNFIMGASLMASTAMLLILGTLTLSGQADSISRSWSALNVVGVLTPELWIIKVICLLVTFIVAFFAFVMSVRLTNHVVFMINIPERNRHSALTTTSTASLACCHRRWRCGHSALTTTSTASRLNRAGDFFAIGMRAFFFAVPLVFWLFGPMFLVIATLGLIITLYHLDRNKSAQIVSD
jgi:uncharacterized membrane protein